MQEAAAYVIKMKIIQESLIVLIENENNTDNDYQNFNKLLTEEQVKTNKSNFKDVLQMISRIEREHYRNPSFFTNIINILKVLENDIIGTFSYEEIFNIFAKSRRILFFFFQKLQNRKYDYNYYYSKISKCYQSVEESKRKDLYDFFVVFVELESYPSKYNKRTLKERKKYFKREIKKEEIDSLLEKINIGENDSLVCELIREDKLKEFQSLIESTKLTVSDQIRPSIFETNYFLIDKTPTLIEYAAFFGSINIFKYLIKLEVPINDSIFLYAIHGRNCEIIHIIEEKPLKLTDKVITESIKCFHHELSDYFINNIGTEGKLYPKIFKTPNYCYFPKVLNDNVVIYYLCKYGNLSIVNLLQKDLNDLNLDIIYNKVF